MSTMSQLKKKVGYETNVRRCKNCIDFKKSMIVLIKNSNTKRLNHHCKKHGFSIAENSVCDTWQAVASESTQAISKIKGQP